MGIYFFVLLNAKEKAALRIPIQTEKIICLVITILMKIIKKKKFELTYWEIMQNEKSYNLNHHHSLLVLTIINS